MIINNKVTHRTVKQYENNNGVVMFIDDTKNYKTTVSFCDISGKKIDNNDMRALTFFNYNAYLVMELGE